MIGPIGEADSKSRKHADWLLDGIIKPVFAARFSEFEVTRSDKISDPGSIPSQIIIRLHEAELVIADMSLQNANAFYELGIRHTLRKPTIHMFMRGEPLPFDVAPYRAAEFSYERHADLITARADLAAAVEAVLKQKPNDIQNPVTQALGAARFAESASEPQRVLEAQISHLTQQVRFLSDRIDQFSRPSAVPVGPALSAGTSPLSALPLSALGRAGDFFNYRSSAMSDGLADLVSNPPRAWREDNTILSRKKDIPDDGTT